VTGLGGKRQEAPAIVVQAILVSSHAKRGKTPEPPSNGGKKDWWGGEVGVRSKGKRRDWPGWLFWDVRVEKKKIMGRGRWSRGGKGIEAKTLLNWEKWRLSS